MNEVRFIQKIGQVPMAHLVENAAKLGFVLVGSPTLISNVPAQLMIQADKPATAPEYVLVEKTGQLKLSDQVEQLLDEGWQIYGSMLTGEVPMQAMVRGDIGVHKMYGLGSSDPGDGKDWGDEIDSLVEMIADAKESASNDLKHSMNSINEAGEMLDERVKDTERQQMLLEAGLGELIVSNQKEHDSITAQGKKYTDDKCEALYAQIGSELEVNRDFAMDIGNSVARACEEADEVIKTELKMETAERIQDVADLNARIDQMTRIIAQLVDQPAS